MENGIINFIGVSCTGGALLIWARETFMRNVEEEKEGILTRLFNFVNDLFYRHIPIADDFEELAENEEETEQPWKRYVRHPESHGKYKVTI